MGQKRAARGSFQANIVELLRQNPDRCFTFYEIADELGATHGSTSGTLSALCKKGTIQKTNDHPAKYFYSTNKEATSSEVKLNNESGHQTITDQIRPNLASGELLVLNIKQEVEEIDRQIKELEKRRLKLKLAIEVLEERLNLEKNNIST
ncbi:MAG: hypothetical protein RM021_024340 [Nostoc sp. EkiNYC01]|nr:hypothetical protein [Nostoc sp. EkiNYC01]